MANESLYSHSFTTEIPLAGLKILKQVHGGPLSEHPERQRDFVWSEIYTLRVWSALHEVLNCYMQLEQIVDFVADFSYSQRMKKSDITRYDYLRYTVENYIIRTQMIEDRLLQLVNRVFDLGMKPSDCRYGLVVGNERVAATDVPSLLGAVRKALKLYREQRHVIVHRDSHSDSELNELQGLELTVRTDPTVIEELEVDLGPIREMKAQCVRAFVASKRSEFSTFNEKLSKLIYPVFSELHKRYKQEKTGITHKLLAEALRRKAEREESEPLE